MRFLSILIGSCLALGLSAQRYYFENISVAQGLPATKVYCALQDSTGLVWLGTESGLASFDGTNVIAFGPNEVYRVVIAKAELGKYRESRERLQA